MNDPRFLNAQDIERHFETYHDVLVRYVSGAIRGRRLACTNHLRQLVRLARGDAGKTLLERIPKNCFWDPLNVPGIEKDMTNLMTRFVGNPKG